MKLIYAREPDEHQVHWGNCEDPRGKLTAGESYEVDRIDVHSWHTKVFLVGVDSGRGFNDVSFDREDGE